MTGSGPQPTSLPEAVNAAVGISKLHEGAAQTAMQMAETERQRRMEAEQSRGAAAAAAADEEASKWDALTQMQNSFREEMGAMRSELHQAQIAQKDSEAARLVAEMKAHAEKVEAAIKAEKERVESELARTRAENAALRQRPTLQELQVRAIQNPDDPELAPFRQVYGNRGESIDEWARKEQLSRHFRSQDAEERRKEERHRSGLRLRRNLDGLFGEARGALGRFTPGQPRGLDLNGVSADFPDDPPADPEGDVAADA